MTESRFDPKIHIIVQTTIEESWNSWLQLQAQAFSSAIMALYMVNVVHHVVVPE
jgi:hypothetical protein